MIREFRIFAELPSHAKFAAVFYTSVWLVGAIGGTALEIVHQKFFTHVEPAPIDEPSPLPPAERPVLSAPPPAIWQLDQRRQQLPTYESAIPEAHMEVGGVVDKVIGDRSATNRDPRIHAFDYVVRTPGQSNVEIRTTIGCQKGLRGEVVCGPQEVLIPRTVLSDLGAPRASLGVPLGWVVRSGQSFNGLY